jgi:hypothetical protein
MSFLNLLMLGGVAAFSIPLLIHIFNKSRFKIVPWGAMHLLEAVVRINKKRIRIEQLLLLLVRCAIPVILALCMARPVLTGWRSLMGDAPASAVVLLDNSYSMDAGGASGTNFDKAVAETGGLLGRMKRGSEVSVLLMGGGPEPVFDKPTFDPAGMAERLRQLKAGYGPIDATGSMEAGAMVISDMTNAKRDLIVVSDFQKSDWDAVNGAERRRVDELIHSMKIAPSLTFFKVGAEIKDNVCVESLDVTPKVVGVGQTINVRANLRSYGAKSYPDMRVYFRVDGKQIAASQVALGAEERSQVLFTHKFDKGGSHVIEVEADAPDLKADNSYSAAIPVLSQLPVLLVSGDVSPKPLEGETDFIEIALQPYTSGKSAGLADLVQTTVIDAKLFTPESLKGQRAVVLANVNRLSDPQVAALREFVKQGGGVMVFLGNKIDLNWYNTVLAAPQTGLLPMRIDQLAGSQADLAKQSSIVAQHYDHASLQLFNDRRNGSLADGQVQVWYKMSDPRQAVADQDKPAIIARLETGDPLLVEKRIGEGGVIVCATSADVEWNNLPARPFFLPLMQQLVTYLATSAEPPHNVEVGKPLVAFLPREAAGTSLTMIDPDSRKHQVKAVEKNGRAVIEFERTRRPGVYTLAGPTGEPTHFVVNTDRGESKLEQLTEADLQKLGEQMHASVVKTGDEYASIDQNRRHGREVWRWMLWSTLALLFGELLLQQWFAKGKA